MAMVRRGHSWVRSLAMAGAVLIGSAAGVAAQQTERGTKRQPPADKVKPDGSASGAAGRNFGPVRRLKRELSPNAAGQVETPAPVETKGDTNIVPASEPAAAAPTGERRAPPATTAPAPAQPAAGQPGNPAAGTLDDGRVNDLRACKTEVAADRKGSARKVVAGKVTVRWTVQPDGTVRNPDVVALTDTDPAVTSCIERKVAAWVFARPEGGAAISFERALSF
jgi:hypothetical protein